MSTARERHPDAYLAGYVQRQLEQAGISSTTPAAEALADLICAAQERGRYDIADQLSLEVLARVRGLGAYQRPLSPEEESDWWLAFYHGRRDARLAADR